MKMMMMMMIMMMMMMIIIIIIILIIIIVARSLARNQDSFAFGKVRPDVNFVSEMDKVGKKNYVW
jgi:biopolymer transport protein ExbB/TolQ